MEELNPSTDIMTLLINCLMYPHKNMLSKKAYDHSKDQKNYLPSCVLFVRVVSTLKFYDDALLHNTSFIMKVVHLINEKLLQHLIILFLIHRTLIFLQFSPNIDKNLEIRVLFKK